MDVTDSRGRSSAQSLNATVQQRLAAMRWAHEGKTLSLPLRRKVFEQQWQEVAATWA
jgi:hypothetical protein